MTSSSLEFCVRNTEEAEKATQAGANRRGQAKGVWGMIEQSELAESIREDDKRKVEEQIDIPSLLSCQDPTDIPSPPSTTTAPVPGPSDPAPGACLQPLISPDVRGVSAFCLIVV